MAAMFLRRCSSIAISRVRGYASSTTPSTRSAVSVMLKHMTDLAEKRDHLLQMRRDLRGVKVLDRAQLEVLRMEPRIVDQLHLLQSLYNEIVPDGHISRCPLIIIPNHQRAINQRLFSISQIEESLPPQVQLLKLQSTKSRLLCYIKLLTKVFEDIAWEIELGSDPSRGVFDLMLKSKNPTAVFTSTHMSQTQSVRQLYTTQNQGLELSMGKNEAVESGALRYLLISNGCEIHCLDLHAREFLSTSSISGITQLLPIIATLNLLEENLPAAVALFKWSSNALLIGGMKLPKALEKGDIIFQCREGETPKGIKLYHSLCQSDKGKHTPCPFYGLSLDDAKTSLEFSNMGKLKKPKTWPIVEEINGQIHVIDRRSKSVHSCPSYRPSHEVLDRDNGCWVEEIPMLKIYPIDSYSVIGQKVYAVSINDDTMDRAFLVFDSREKLWDVVSMRYKHHPEFRDVWDILEKVTVVRCVGGFPYGDVRDPLYVLIGLDSDKNFGKVTTTVAFLVNSEGLVLCMQPLVHFFKCIEYISQGQIINVEEEDKKKTDKKKTMCSIITGSPWDDVNPCNRGDYVCINIFSVEELPDAAYKVRQVAPKGSDGPVELEFVRVDVIDKHVYRIDPEAGGNSFDWNDLQACFM